jgi:hypothetical protein
MTIPPAGPEIRAGDDGSDNPNFKLVRFRKIKLDRHPPYLVRGLIPRKGLIVVYGPPKCGKTFIVFDLCMHIALGWEYRDRCTQPGNVVYIACEGERGLAARKEAFQQQKLGEEADPPFYLITSKLNLPVQHAELILDISGQLPPGESCVAIVLDTLNRSIGGSENKDEDMTAYITAADALRERFRCAVIIIHHTGINQTRPRGHTSLTGAADAQIAVRREDSHIIATVEFMKDGLEGDSIVSTLKVVEVDEDENGDAISSCIVESADDTKLRRAKRRLSPSKKRALDLLRDAIGREGKTPPTNNHIPSNTPCVDEDLWRRFCYEGQITQSDTPNAKRQAFNRAANSLIAAGLVGKWGDMVWTV